MLGSASSYTDDKHLDFASLVTSMSILQTSWRAHTKSDHKHLNFANTHKEHMFRYELLWYLSFLQLPALAIQLSRYKYLSLFIGDDVWKIKCFFVSLVCEFMFLSSVDLSFIIMIYFSFMILFSRRRRSVSTSNIIWS
jgi:hypothetical protein